MAGTSGSAAGNGTAGGAQTDAAGAVAAGWTSAAGAGLRLRGVARVFGETVAVSGVDLDVPLHGRLAIVGPSGCGKSALLNMICGLDQPTAGTSDVLDAQTAQQ